MALKSDCAYTPEQARTDSIKTLGDILEKAGVTSCKTTAASASSYKSLNGSLKYKLLGGLGGTASAELSASMGDADSKSSTEGCESLIASSEKYQTTINNVKCNLQSVQSNTTASLIIQQEVEIGLDATLECGEIFEGTQKAEGTLTLISTLTSSQKDQITNTITDGLKRVAETMSKSETGFGSTEAGKKILTDIQKSLTSNDITSSISKTITDTLATMTANQKITIKGKIRSRKCIISQDVLLSLVATNMVNDSFDKVFSNYTTQSAEHNSKNASDSKAIGTPAAGQPQPKKKNTNTILGILGGTTTSIISFSLSLSLLSSLSLFLSNQNSNE